MLKKYLNRREAAAYLTALGLKTSPNTLQKQATVGGGPPYNFGAIERSTRRQTSISMRSGSSHRRAVLRVKRRQLEIMPPKTRDAPVGSRGARETDWLAGAIKRRDTPSRLPSPVLRFSDRGWGGGAPRVVVKKVGFAFWETILVDSNGFERRPQQVFPNRHAALYSAQVLNQALREGGR